MLKKIFRLPKVKLKSEEKIVSQHLVIKVAKNNIKESRFGFVVSKKIDKKATARNKIKRELRNIVQENLGRIKPGFDFLIIVKKQNGKGYDELEEELKKNNYYL